MESWASPRPLPRLEEHHPPRPRPAPGTRGDFSKATALLTCFMTRSCGEGIVAASMKDEPLIPPGTASPSIVPAKDLMSGAASQPIHPACRSPCPGGCPFCPVGWGGRGWGTPSPDPHPPTPPPQCGSAPQSPRAVGQSPFSRRVVELPGNRARLRSQLERPSCLLAPPHPDSPRLAAASTGPGLRGTAVEMVPFEGGWWGGSAGPQGGSWPLTGGEPACRGPGGS